MYDGDTKEFIELVKGIKDTELLLLKLHLHVERSLDLIIELYFENPKSLLKKGKFTFNQKLNLVEAMGVIDYKIIQSLYQLNKTRNNLSHRLDFRIDKNTITNIGSPLGKEFTRIRKKYENKEDVFIFIDLLHYLSGSIRGKQLRISKKQE